MQSYETKLKWKGINSLFCSEHTCMFAFSGYSLLDKGSECDLLVNSPSLLKKVKMKKNMYL